jgi:hypothetical protein
LVGRIGLNDGFKLITDVGVKILELAQDLGVFTKLLSDQFTSNVDIWKVCAKEIGLESG